MILNSNGVMASPVIILQRSDFIADHMPCRGEVYMFADDFERAAEDAWSIVCIFSFGMASQPRLDLAKDDVLLKDARKLVSASLDGLTSASIVATPGVIRLAAVSREDPRRCRAIIEQASMSTELSNIDLSEDQIQQLADAHESDER